MTKGYLHMITVPVPGDIFINGEYRGTGNVNVKVYPGIYDVSFGDMTGYTTPLSKSIDASPGFVNEITVEYIKL